MFIYELPSDLRPTTSRLGSFVWQYKNYKFIKIHIENFKSTKKRALHPSNLSEV